MPFEKVFISYTQADRAWAEWIAWQLDGAGYEPKLQAWHFGAGSNFVHEMHKTLLEADRTIAVLSPDYERSPFCITEWAGTFVQDAIGEARKLVPVRVEPYKPTGFLSAIVYVDLVGIDEETAREELFKGLQGPGPPKVAPGFPGGRKDGEKRFPGVLPSVWTIPYRRNTYFVGREEILGQLQDRLIQDGSAALGQNLAISGLGGIGKTQTAVEYACRYRNEYQAVFFVRADTEAEILSGFGELARELGLGAAQEQDRVVAEVLAWLRDNDRWLLIFDNADKPELVRPYLPANHRGHVLVTSRARVFSGLGIRRPFRMPTLALNEAVKLLLERSEREEADVGDEEHVACEQLAEELGCLPLALEQAGAYLYEKGSRFQDYLSGYRSRGLKLLDQGKPIGHPKVAVTWSLNFAEVEDTSPASAEILRASAFLSPDEIPLEILWQGGSALGPTLADTLAEAQDDGLIVDEILEPLTRYSLISRKPGGQTYSIHRLVQEVVKRDMEASRRREWANQVVRALDKTFPDAVELTNWPLCDQLMAHTELAKKMVRYFDLVSGAAGHLFHHAGVYLWYRARYEESESLYLRSLEIKEKAFGNDHLEVARTLNNLGILYRNQGRYEEAEPLYLRSLEIKETSLGKNHTEVATAFHSLGSLYYTQGLYKKAEPLFQSCLEVKQRALGKDHIEAALTLNNLGNLYTALGRYREAELSYKQSLTITEKLSKDHPEVARTLNNLGTLFRYQGRYEEAEPLYLRSLEIEENVLGTAHPEVAETLTNLGTLYRDQGRHADAERQYLRALEIEKNVLGKEHPKTSKTLSNLGILYSDQGRYEKAERLFLHSLEITEKALGKDHPLLAQTLDNLGALYSSQGRYGEAEPLSLRCLKIEKKALGNDHPSVALTLNNLGLLYFYQGRYEEAEPLYRRSLEIAEKALGKKHPSYSTTLRNYTKLVRATGREADDADESAALVEAEDAVDGDDDEKANRDAD